MRAPGRSASGPPDGPRPWDTLVVVLGAFTASAAGVVVVAAGVAATDLPGAARDLLVIGAGLGFATAQPQVVRELARRGGWRLTPGRLLAGGTWISGVLLLLATLLVR